MLIIPFIGVFDEIVMVDLAFLHFFFLYTCEDICVILSCIFEIEAFVIEMPIIFMEGAKRAYVPRLFFKEPDHLILLTFLP